jgi:AbrB family looped-hinge helix DNA binding protein
VKHKITAKGQITIPRDIRDHLGVKPGDYVKVFAYPNGTAVILPVKPVSSLKGILKSPFKRPVTIEEMNDGIAAGARASLGADFRLGPSARRQPRIAKR